MKKIHLYRFYTDNMVLHRNSRERPMWPLSAVKNKMSAEAMGIYQNTAAALCQSEFPAQSL